MKTMKLCLVLVGITGTLACNSSNTQNNQVAASTATDAVFISTHTANRMVQSYLSSIQHTEGQIHSLIMDVDSLRVYFSDTSIRKVKLMFAHTMAYINAGHEGQPAGYGQDAFTIVMAGVDRQGDYVLSPLYKVPNEAVPCPHNCWNSGTAMSDLLPPPPVSMLTKAIPATTHQSH